MRLIGLVSSAKAASAALMVDGTVVKEAFSLEQKRHSETLLPLLDEILTQAGMEPAEADAFAVDIGPGSFTGIRIGVATIKGYNLALGKKYIELNTLQAIALSANCGAKGSAIIDAGNGYYFADYTNNTSPCLIAYDDIRAQNAGTAKLASQYLDGLVELCRSKYSAGNFDDNLSPLYIRKSQAEENATKK